MKTEDIAQEVNQQFLANAIQLIREQLELYAQSVDDNKYFPENGYSEKMQELIREAGKTHQRIFLVELCIRLNLSDFERDILLLSAVSELDSEFSTTLSRKRLNHQPTFALAFAIFPESHWEAITPGSTLRRLQLIKVGKSETLINSPIYIEEPILHFIAGVDEVNEKLKKITEPVAGHYRLVPSQLQLAELILNTCLQQQTSEYPSIFLMGNERADKLNTAAFLSSHLGLSLHTLSMYSVPNDVSEIVELTLLWNRESLLKDYALFLDVSEADINDKSKLQPLIHLIKNVQGLIIVSSDHWVPDSINNRFSSEIKKPLSNEQLLLWEQQVGEIISQKALHRLVSQFSMNTEIIKKAQRELLFHFNVNNASLKKSEAENALWGICCRLTRPQTDGLAQRIETKAIWDELVLPVMQKDTLKEIAIHVRQRNKVYEEWGFEKKDSRGLGITALFAGESGTGKTMAAEVLANELNLDLYRIDLSKVINKYIGETEKNLKKIFDAAENGGAILLFDEADALFGKRSDVKDSHDRHSNIEVSYLLQRMESYRGLAILTTNMKNALDKAFLRRIRFVVQFQFPDFVQRAEIWDKIFPATTPKEGLDFSSLAKLNLSGGSIRNVALNAAFLAAEEDMPVFMSHISRAAKSEYLKLEKPFNSFELK